jgi:hypothetical protein
MKRYRNLDGHAGIRSYEYGPGWIHIWFTRGGGYRYTSRKVGPENLATMKKLADGGKCLTTFINQHPVVKMGYTRRIV